MLERRLQHLTTVLELNTTQQAQAKTIFTDEATALQALRTRQTEARDAMQNAVKNTGLDADIERAATQIGALHTQALTIQGKAQAKFRAILTTQQKEKLDAMRGGGMGAPGMGGPGGPRGPRGGGRF
jgi:Spy/CpxP family protein refolding chaperone